MAFHARLTVSALRIACCAINMFLGRRPIPMLLHGRTTSLYHHYCNLLCLFHCRKLFVHEDSWRAEQLWKLATPSGKLRRQLFGDSQCPGLASQASSNLLENSRLDHRSHGWRGAGICVVDLLLRCKSCKIGIIDQLSSAGCPLRAKSTVDILTGYTRGLTSSFLAA